MRASFAITLVLLPAALAAQETDLSVRFRVAQGFEQAGDWERAVPIYESLYQSEPQNYVYFDALRRGYTQLKLYDKALILIENRLKTQKEDVLLLSSLGGVYYQMGEDLKADSVWQSVITTSPKNSNLYRLVASQMMEYRLFDQAIKMFLAARAATGNAELFLDELVNIYAAFQQYEQATREYVMMLTTRPGQLPYVQSRMAVFVTRPEALRTAHRVVQEEVNRRSEEVPLRFLLAWLLMEGRDFDSALEEYRVIDRLTKGKGTEIFNFGQRAAQEKAFRVAAKAFKEVIETSPSKEMFPFARFGYARALEEISTETDSSVVFLEDRSALFLSPTGVVSETRTTYAGVLRLFEAMIEDYPKSEFAAQSSFRIGVIKKDRFFDLDGALSAFGQVRNFPKLPLATEAAMQVGEVLTTQNNLAKAHAEYAAISSSNAPEIRDRALFRMAELNYFEAKFDSAIGTLQRLTTNMGTDLANDALQLLYFIQENKAGDPAALREFAGTDLLIRQRKYSEALGRFQSIVKQYPQALLVDDATLKIGELHVLLRHPQEALAVLRSVVNDMPGSILRDRAQMKIGEVYQAVLKDPLRAIEAYELLLTKFPHSLYVGEARRRIRLLRGDAI